MTDHPPRRRAGPQPTSSRHPPGDERLWGESWYFDFTDREGTLGGYVRLGLYPNLGVAWYWACLVGEGRPLVTVIDHEVALPKAPSLEIRAEGLWADHTVETPFDHMTLGCEAFAVGVDDPAEVYGDLRGDRVPFGLDLEWETDRGGLYPWIGTTRYEVSCNVHGEILVGDETHRASTASASATTAGACATGGTLGWVWTAGGLEDGTRFHTTRIRVPGPRRLRPGLRAAARWGRGADRRVHRRARSSASTASPPRRRSCADPSTSPSSPRYFSPVHLIDDDGTVTRHARFPRALCRFEASRRARRRRLDRVEPALPVMI